jgi:hypothetical protein
VSMPSVAWNWQDQAKQARNPLGQFADKEHSFTRDGETRFLRFPLAAVDLEPELSAEFLTRHARDVLTGLGAILAAAIWMAVGWDWGGALTIMLAAWYYRALMR